LANFKIDKYSNCQQMDGYVRELGYKSKVRLQRFFNDSEIVENVQLV